MPENMRCALLILDMQKGYYNDLSKDSMDKASEYINYAIDLFRKNNLPIIWVCDDGKGGIVNGTIDFEIIDILNKNGNEIIIHKKYKNGFNKTVLLDYINELSIDTLVITGFSAEYCVLSTYRAAEDYDLRPIMLKNALGCYKNIYENIKFVENISETVTIDNLEKMIDKTYLTGY